MTWVKIYDQRLEQQAEQPIPTVVLDGLRYRRLNFSCTSENPRPTWRKALDAVQFVRYPIIDAPNLEFFRRVIPLNQHKIIDLPSILPATTYSLHLRIPPWLENITIQLWEFQGDINPVVVPVRSVGCIEAKMRVGAIAPYRLEYDGYWVCLTDNNIRTIGNTASGSSIAESWARTLFEAIWENANSPILYSSTGVVVGRGTTARIDWDANRRITLPEVRNRVLIGAGTLPSGGSQTANKLDGAETITLTVANLPSHRHRLNVLSIPGSNGRNVNNASAGSVDQYFDSGGGQPFVENTGGGQSFRIMQPSHAVDFWMSAGAR